MRFPTAILLLSVCPLPAELRDVVKSAEIDKIFAQTSNSADVLAKTNYAVQFRVISAGEAARTAVPDAGEFWFVRRGSADISLSGRRHQVNAGDVVNVPRGTEYRIRPTAGRFEFVAVRVFPAARRMRIGIGAAPEPLPMPDVSSKAAIDATLATAAKNVTLHSAGAVLINHVIYNAAHGPWEVHQTCDDLYFVRLGSAHAKLDGTLIGGKEDPLGEIRGSGVTGARDFTIAPGDMVVVPRNTAHFMDPGSARLGYLLVKICD
ncbi:MAG: AraC family ligand binding domain-containing protein [Bryobacterales bacterium]|nr:AraC family ligand binding domain-containing protein [Bryobacterales bacterium]